MTDLTVMRQLIGMAVRARRRELGWRPERLASVVGVSVMTVSRLERGVKLPRAETLLAIARELEISLEAVADASADAATPKLTQ